jgi:large subunit ribosomal protein L44e
MQYKAGKRRAAAQGQRRYVQKQAGYSGQTRPIFRKKSKVTKKIVLKLQCSNCKRTAQKVLKRCRHFEISDRKKPKSADPAW